ncbi:MAG: helix-turn-helix domain-containing protein [Propionibacteriaceae bacterium]|nr:helix-turn-helix domain-containing protein [Propionibacteriaceae bacterium]
MPKSRDTFIAACDAKLRLVRTEADLTQQDMAFALGLSKKTLVDIEKGRRTLGWSGAVTMCAVFPTSDILTATFGDTPLNMIPALAAEEKPIPQGVSAGNPWWDKVADNGDFIIEQNTISQHYRLLTSKRVKIAAAFDIDDLLPLFHGQTKEN